MRILSMDLFCHYISVFGAKKKATPAILWQRCVLMMIFLEKNLYDGVWAVVFALAGFAVFAHPDVVELLHGLLDDLWNIGQDARLEIALIAALHADAGSREVSAADIHLLAVKHQHLKVHPWTQHPLQSVIQHGIPVKVLPEVRPWLLSMNQPHLHTSPNQQRDNRQERLLLLTNLHI